MMPGSNDCLPWTPQDLKRNISDRFEKVVERYSDSVALSGSSGSLTYQELNQRANSLARSILHKLGGEEEPIALIFQHDIDLIVAQMATLKAGKAYVCLDLDLPESRLRSIVTQLEPRICLTNDQCYPLALSIIREKSLLLNCDQIDLNSSNDNLSYSWKSERLAAIFFTSGSTGKPKGVKRDHKGILHRSQVDIDAHCVSPQDRCSLLTSCSHGSSSSDVFCALLSGATLSLLPIRSEGIISLADWIDREAITILHMPVEFLRQWMDLAPDREKLHSVRLLRPAGKLYRSDIEAIRKVFPKHCLIRSQLSSAETNLLTYMIIDYDKEIKTPIVPVGYAVEGKQILLLDDNGNQANPGEAGEIVVKSLYLSSGYWKNEQLEQQKFIPGNDHDPRTLFFTGDLGRWNTDGMLELIGRKDSMIKVRGYRVEISEVEAALLAIDAVKQVTVIGGVSAPESCLIAYVVLKQMETLTVSDLRRELTQRLPDYMMPSRFVILDQLPLFPNGKVNVKALPKPSTNRPEQNVTYISPSTSLQVNLINIWCEELNIDQIGIDDHFLDLGGNSLAAMRISAKISIRLNMEIGLQQIFELASVRAIADLIEREGTLTPTVLKDVSIPKRITTSPCPVSHAQQRWWLLHQSNPENPAFNWLKQYKIEGDLDRHSLQKALNKLVSRHEILRTVYEIMDGELKQIIQPQAELSLDQIWVENEDYLRQTCRDFLSRPFDLSQDIPIRAIVISMGPDRHQLVVVTHHIATDHESSRLLTHELDRLYQIYYDDHEPQEDLSAIQYADFAVWQRDKLDIEDLNQHLSYWLDQLDPEYPILNIPTDKPRPNILGGQSGRVRLTLTEDLNQKLKAINRQEQVTMATTVVAIFSLFLYKYSGQKDLLIGCPVSGRDHTDTRLLIGCLLNTLMLRISVDPDLTLRDLIRRAREVLLRSIEFQDLPFEKLMEKIPHESVPDISALFRVMVNCTEVSDQGKSDLGSTCKLKRIDSKDGTSLQDLTLYSRQVDDGHYFELEYSTDLLGEETALRMLNCIEVLLGILVSNPDQIIGKICPLTRDEQQQIVSGWNQTHVDYAKIYPGSLTNYFEKQVAKTPTAPMFIAENGDQLTYHELDRRSNQLSHYLRSLGIDKGEVVAIALPRSFEQVIAFYAVLKLGGVYLPLDPSYPAERLAMMLKDSEASVVISRSPYYEKLSCISEIVDLERDCSHIHKCPNQSLNVHNSPQDLAYIIFTSGSTGRPKGIMIPHVQIINRLAWMWVEYPFETSEVLCHKTALGFVDSLWELLGGALQGIPTVIISDQTLRDLHQFIHILNDCKVSRLWLVPSLLRTILDTIPDLNQQLPQLRFWVASGEILTTDLAKRFKTCLPQGHLYNLYGTSEVWDVTWTEYDPIWDSLLQVPIGKPIANMQTYILDETLNPVPVGVRGELYIGGVGLATGYLKQPDLTAASFIPNPFDSENTTKLYKSGDIAYYLPDGNIQLEGRANQQIKIRGFRVEPAEIEKVIEEMISDLRAVVVPQLLPSNEQCLIGFLQVAPDQHIDIDQLGHDLEQKLPDYMIPSFWIKLDHFPHTPSGKLDRLALVNNYVDLDEMGGLAHTPPRTQVESQLVKIWEELLKKSPIGIKDPFHRLGGNSLLSIQLLTRVEQEFQRKLPVHLFFQPLTIESLAQAIAQSIEESGNEQIQPHPALLKPEEYRLLLASISGVEGKRLGSNQIIVQIEKKSDRAGQLPFFWIGPEEIAHELEYHPLFLLPQAKTYEFEEPETYITRLANLFADEIQSVDPSGPCVLGGYCFTAWVALATAHRLRERGIGVEQLLLVEIPSPNSIYNRLAKRWEKTLTRLERYARSGPSLVSKLREKMNRNPDPISTVQQEAGNVQENLFEIKKTVKTAVRSHLFDPCSIPANLFFGYGSQYYLHPRIGDWGPDLLKSWGWQGLFQGPTQIHQVACYGPVFVKPHVETLARSMEAVLRDDLQTGRIP